MPPDRRRTPQTLAATSVEVVGDVERETIQGDTRQSSRDSSFGVTLARGGPGLNLGASAARQATRSRQERTRRSGQERYHVPFGPLSRALRGVAGALGGARLWILLDEWSSLPAELQPFLADLLRRSLFPVRGITVKIAAIQRRSCFRQVRENGDYVGIEVGADAAAGLDLDDFLIVGREEERTRSFPRSLLFNHAIAHTAQPGRLGRAAAGQPEAARREHPASEDLYDARLLHVPRHGIIVPEHPGTRHDGPNGARPRSLTGYETVQAFIEAYGARQAFRNGGLHPR